MKRAIEYLRHHAIALTALAVALLALGSTSYAAFTIDGHQIRNHTIDPVKFDRKFINGSVRAWAVVTSKGRVVAGGGGPHVIATVIPGSFELRWTAGFSRSCATVATIDPDHSPPTTRVMVPGNPAQPVTSGYAVAASTRNHSARGLTFVTTFNQAGQLTPLGFDVLVLC